LAGLYLACSRAAAAVHAFERLASGRHRQIMPAMSLRQPDPPLLIHFGAESVDGVSRSTLRAIAAQLHLNERQTIHFALARLRDQLLHEVEDGQFTPLTAGEHLRIANAAPGRRGKVLDSLLR
jgi:hypothetical protein